MSAAVLSRILYAPTTIVLYFSAAFFYLYALTTTVGRRDERQRGAVAQRIGTALTVLALGAHVAHEIVRGIAQSRLPLGNMFEVTSLMALVGVAAGVGYLQFVRKRPQLNGFVLLAGGLLMAFASFMYAEPGPLMPILDTWWRPFHVSLLVGAMGIFGAGFVFNGLFLLRDSGDRALAAAPAVPIASGLAGAVDVGTADGDGVVLTEPDYSGGAVPGDGIDDRTSDHLGDGGGDDDAVEDAGQAAIMRGAVSWVRLALGTFAGSSLVSWVFLTSADSARDGLTRFLTINLVLVAAALLARWFIPLLPSGATLDGLAHRVIAFAFVLWTVGTIAGAMWAEQSWGRFWGWDPKETGAFLTWVVYAAYLHARATRGVKGRPAAWIGIVGFIVLMGTYLIANYVIVGLHSYAGL